MGQHLSGFVQKYEIGYRFEPWYSLACMNGWGYVCCLCSLSSRGLGLVDSEMFFAGLFQSVAEGERTKARYRVYRFDVSMTRDQHRLEQFLNSLEGEVAAIIPNVPLCPPLM